MSEWKKTVYGANPLKGKDNVMVEFVRRNDSSRMAPRRARQEDVDWENVHQYRVVDAGTLGAAGTDVKHGGECNEVRRFPLDPLAHQEGGNHYKDMPIQPVEFIHANALGYFEGNVIKYVSRWRKKNGLADLQKARHYIDLLIDLETKKTAG